MGFKKMGRSLDFAGFALSSSLEANRSVKLMEKINASINWSRVEAVLMSHYKNGKPLKFSRDLENDWTFKNEVPHFGLKKHAAVDAKHGFT